MKCLENNAENIKEAIKVLKAGGVIAHPADTCYGLAGDLMNEQALKKLQQIKGRDAKKPMSIMLPAHMKAALRRFVRLTVFAEKICEKLLPGPVTIVLPKGPEIPDYFFPEMPTIGIRIPYDAKTNYLLMAFKGPIITTSANLSDKPVCCNCEDVIGVFRNKAQKPDLLLDGDLHGVCLPSTVISLEGKKVRILREGPLNKVELSAVLGTDVE
ncbi:MAG: L-threonylcarbamoyladenylate synthase [Patescibacteria group bacterium]